MFDTQNNLHDRGILDVLNILSGNGESGRLEMQAGTTEGFFFVKNGRLVDARVGDLTGFQAINAVAAMPGARFTFDPSAVPPSVSSITPSERVVLKQFFGIDTFEPHDVPEPPAFTNDEEATIETSRIPLPVEPLPAAPVPQISSSRPLFYRGALVLALLFILIAAGAVALRNQYRERVLTAAAATAEQPAAPTAPVATAEQPSAPAAGVATAEHAPAPAVAEVPAAKEIKTDKPSTPVAETSVAQDLSGKWNVVNIVQKTTYRSFENIKIGFDLSISQNGNSFTGKGQKISENGRTLPASSRTPIQVKGSIKGDRVEATFFEDGSLRKTNGRFVWRIDKAGALNGTFISTAAGARGKSAAKKEL